MKNYSSVGWNAEKNVAKSCHYEKNMHCPRLNLNGQPLKWTCIWKLQVSFLHQKHLPNSNWFNYAHPQGWTLEFLRDEPMKTHRLCGGDLINSLGKGETWLFYKITNKVVFLFLFGKGRSPCLVLFPAISPPSAFGNNYCTVHCIIVEILNFSTCFLQLHLALSLLNCYTLLWC